MKNEKVHTIEVVFEQSCARHGHAVVEWLINAGVAEQTNPSAETQSGLVCRAFTALREIAADSVIVFVSDAATANRDWFNYVNNVSDKKRIIPVGAIEAVDYNDPEVLPARIEEINFIRLDENLKANIMDSLTTDPDFYALKNHLLLKCKRWGATRDEGNLLTDTGRIKAYAATAAKKLGEETDQNLRTQLNEIISYLEESRRYARKIRRQSIARWLLLWGTSRGN